MTGKLTHGDELPTAFVDGWFGHKNYISKTQNPYRLMAQFASYELWTEGWDTRHYAERNNEPLWLDDFKPRALL